jgi:transposase
MRLNEKYQNNYTSFQDSYQLVLPLYLDNLIPEDDSVRLLSHELEGLDYTELYKAYSSKGRKSALEPKTMFKILVYAYSQNIYSTREIEKSCHRDINFRWLLAGAKAPDHTTIDRFRKKYAGSSIENLFYQFVNHLHEIGEIKYENVFIDGTKIEANANRYSFVWKKTVLKNEAKMHVKVQELMHKINTDYIQNFSFSIDTAYQDITYVVEFLFHKCNTENIEFVHGSGHRPKVLQKQYEQMKEYQERQKAYDQSKQKFQGRNSYSRTDHDATFMHMKEDHMRNGQLKPGYNLQIGVEAEYITCVGVFSERNDINTLIPMLEHMEEMSGHRYANVVADSGYESEEGYLYLEKKGQTPYIKPQTYEKWKKRSFKNDISKRENMIYDEVNDEYICHNGKRLTFRYTGHRKSSNGYISDVSHYECEDCTGCPFKAKCTKCSGNRKMQVSKLFVEKRLKSYENIISENGILLRMNRSIQVEGAFGVLKNDYKYKRFLTRGKNSVKTEFLFLVFGYDINKLHAKIQNKRLGHQLHSLKKSA